MKNTIYKPLKEKIRDFGELKLEVFYCLGGMNYFSGTVSRRGIYLLCKPVSHGNGFESSIMLGGQKESGFKILLEELKRKSQPKIDAQFARITPLVDQIVELYEADKFGDIKDLVAPEVSPAPVSPTPITPPSMKLLTKKVLQRFEKVGSQQEVSDPIVIAKFFNPTGIGTWYATEYNPVDKIFYGYVELHEGEWGSFSLDELESFRGQMGLSIERDRSFQEKRFSEVKVHQYN